MLQLKKERVIPTTAPLNLARIYWITWIRHLSLKVVLFTDHNPLVLQKLATLAHVW